MTRPGGTKLLVRQTGVFYTVEQNEDGKSYLHHIEDFDGFYNYSNYVDLNTYIECVNGLFCFWRETWQPVIICNPSTREVRILPRIDMKFCMCHYSLGFEPEKKIYKVFFMKPEYIEGSLENYTRIWVFALGIDESWNEIESIPQFKRFRGAVCINGVIYMVNSCINRKNIVAFDVKTESFRIVTLWKASDHMIVNFNLIEVKEKLAVVEYNGMMISGEIDMWILGNVQNEECNWERYIIIGFVSLDHVPWELSVGATQPLVLHYFNLGFLAQFFRSNFLTLP
ncbi:PREDICTED: putative F-box protein At1g47730 [Nicotiana attenuata]|uniref:putative F-box protein At1g47730 n=1 Tax=Nicotiana attenuata TaxID=49451 RepID=UPI0009054E5F|nr:PREDICTED: putative F-box protein At1g47730 [Nicotiana attenuata]